MPYCCVPHCESRSGNIQMFAMPQGDRNKQRRQQWKALIKRETFPQSAYVCEFHFAEDQFDNGGLDNKRRLKSSAVPTQFTENEIMYARSLWKKKNTGMVAEIEDEHKMVLPVKQYGRKSNLGLEKGNFVKCRTCLLDKNKENCSIMKKKLLYGETIKQMMIKCVPQTSSSIADDNYICDKCLRCLFKCSTFIDSCLEIEDKIRDGKVIFESGRTDDNTENLEKNCMETDSKSKDNTPDESISEIEGENHEEVFEIEHEDENADKNISENSKNDPRKYPSNSKKLDEICEDNIECEDSKKIDNKPNDLEVKGKRIRKTKKIENAAADEEIEAYLAEEQLESINRRLPRGVKTGKEKEKSPELVVKKIMTDQNSEKIVVFTTTLSKVPNQITRRQKRKYMKREKSPDMEIIDKTLGTTIRTYQRKKVVSNTEGNEGVHTQSESIENIVGHIESPERKNLRTFERKRNSRTTTNNNKIIKKDHVDVRDINKICGTEKIDCDVSSANEHTLGSSPQTDIELSCENFEIPKINHDFVHDISVDHDYIVLTEFEDESVKNITLLDEDGKLISVAAHVEEITSHELPEKVDSNRESIGLRCPSCPTQYKTNKGLCYHLERYHNIREKENIYHCPVCKKEFTEPKEIIDHKHFHGWPCRLCAKIFTSVEELNSHRDTHPQIYSCPECGDEFNTKSSLEQHKTMHIIMMELKKGKAKLPPKRYHCDLCPMVFRYPMRLKVHTNLVHLKLKEYGCHDCGKLFGSKRLLKIHHSVKHRVQKPFQCDLCGDSFKRSDYLKNHYSVHHTKEQSGIGQHDETNQANMFPSEFCGMLLKKGVGSKKNPYTYAITRKYSCDICGLKFKHQRTKLMHERCHNVDSDKKFICPICEKMLSTREELDDHSKRHIRISEKYKCFLCSMSFSRNMLLENHILKVHKSENNQQLEVKLLAKDNQEEVVEKAVDIDGFDCEVDVLK